VIVPEVAAITQIDFDHENFLGHSIEEIAAEKAGIIKPGAWVVGAAGNPAAKEVIRRRTVEQGAHLVEIDPLRVTLGVTGAVVLARVGLRTLWSAFGIRLGGEVEEEVASPRRALNAASALAIVGFAGVLGWRTLRAD